MKTRTSEIYVIRRAFVGSLGILLGLLVVLAGVCVVQGQPAVKIGLLGCIIALLATLLAASFFRRVEVAGDRLVQWRFGRSRSLVFADVTAVEVLTMRKRVFVTLCAGEEFIILSNAYGRFQELLTSLLGRVPSQSVGPEARELANAPPRRHADIWSCWLAIVVVGAILWHQLAVGR